MDKLELIRNHFDEEAREFDGIIRKLIPYYEQMMDALVAAIPFDRGVPLRIMDLGCGTGTLSQKIKEQYPKARVHCVDLVPRMLEMARVKLEPYDHITYSVGDFHTYQFSESFDVVVSSLALHHLISDYDKINFYSKIYNAVNSSGVFYNADVVLASQDHVQNVYIRKWKEFMLRHVSQEEIDTQWMKTYETEDSPAKLMDHIRWLEEVGFRNIDVVWKYYNFCVYGGSKA